MRNQTGTPAGFMSRPAGWPRASVPANVFAIPDESSLRPFPAAFSAYLDDHDHFVRASDNWDVFAPAGCPRHRILGNSIHFFIANHTASECFRFLLEAVRIQHRTVKIAARCDHRWHPRAMRVTFLPSRSGGIEIRWNLIGGPPAQEISVVQPWRFLDGGHLVMCGWCRDVRLEKTWLDLEAAAPLLGLLDHCRLPPITHGICPDCRCTLETEVIEPLAEPVAP